MANKVQVIATGCAIVAAAVVILIVLLLIVFAVAIESGAVPDAVALPAGEIPLQQLRKLEELGVIDKDEKVQYYYSAALFDMESDGSLFTDRRVIRYQGEDGELDISQAPYDQIEKIDFERASWPDDSLIAITTRDGDWFVLAVSSQSDGDQKFYNRLKEVWEREREQAATHKPATGAAEENANVETKTAE